MYIYVWISTLVVSVLTVSADYQEGDLRLTGGDGFTEGRIEIFHNNDWGPISGTNFDSVMGDIVCTSMGFYGAVHSYENASQIFPGLEPTGGMLLEITPNGCSGYDDSITDCNNSGWSSIYNDTSLEAGVQCYLPGYLGCYKDVLVLRVLSHYAKYYYNDIMTPDYCVSHCRSSHYRYAGLEIGYRCYCGEDSDDYTYYGPGECVDPCSGDKDQICGDFARLSVYDTGNCGYPDVPANGYISETSSWNYGETAVYTCETDYVMVGEGLLTCVDSGEPGFSVTWDYDVPSCIDESADDDGVVIVDLTIAPPIVKTTKVKHVKKAVVAAVGFNENPGFKQHHSSIIITLAGVSIGVSAGILVLIILTIVIVSAVYKVNKRNITMHTGVRDIIHTTAMGTKQPDECYIDDGFFDQNATLGGHASFSPAGAMGGKYFDDFDSQVYPRYVHGPLPAVPHGPRQNRESFTSIDLDENEKDPLYQSIYDVPGDGDAYMVPRRVDEILGRRSLHEPVQPNTQTGESSEPVATANMYKLSFDDEYNTRSSTEPVRKSYENINRAAGAPQRPTSRSPYYRLGGDEDASVETEKRHSKSPKIYKKKASKSPYQSQEEIRGDDQIYLKPVVDSVDLYSTPRDATHRHGGEVPHGIIKPIDHSLTA